MHVRGAFDWSSTPADTSHRRTASYSPPCCYTPMPVPLRPRPSIDRRLKKLADEVSFRYCCCLLHWRHYRINQNTIIATAKMARRKFNKPKIETRKSFMFPSLHQDVVNAVSDEIASTWFCKEDSDRGSNNKYSTHVMGRFECNNHACSATGWGSKKVAILIRGYPGNGYNAVVYNQRCKACNQLGRLVLDEKSYVDRVTYRVKKWAGIKVEQQYFEPKEGLPHESDLCEGCKRGVCRQTDNRDYL
jgi:hypothetical protein